VSDIFVWNVPPHFRNAPDRFFDPPDLFPSFLKVLVVRYRIKLTMLWSAPPSERFSSLSKIPLSSWLMGPPSLASFAGSPDERVTLPFLLRGTLIFLNYLSAFSGACDEVSSFIFFFFSFVRLVGNHHYRNSAPLIRSVSGRSVRFVFMFWRSVVCKVRSFASFRGPEIFTSFLAALCGVIEPLC